MMGFRLRRPCAHCPWRSDREPFFGRDARGYARARELEESLQESHVFPCHKTATWDDDGEQQETATTQACAGALITMERGEGMGNLLRMAARLGIYDPAVLDLDSPTYGSLAEWAQAHRAHAGGDAT
jgi:hypothetical protein